MFVQDATVESARAAVISELYRSCIDAESLLFSRKLSL